MRADGYRYKAERCLTRARQMRSPDARWSMIEVAAYWMRLAEHAEHQSDAQQHIEAHDPDTLRNRLVAIRDDL